MTKSADVLVTGASGFIGSAVLRKLARSGYSVRALVRSTSRYRDLIQPGVQFVQGNLEDSQSLKAACAGCRYIFHIAADYRLSLWDAARIMAINVQGTRNLMEEAMRVGVERIVYTSSVATLGCRDDRSQATELDCLNESEAVGPYKRSKIVAEQLVLRMIADQGLPAVIVNPSTPVGPRDIRPTPTGRIIVAAALGQIPIYVNTGLNLVHVDDVAEGHLAALRLGRIGERYILGGQNVLFSQLLTDISQLVGRRGPAFGMPWYLAIPAALAGEAKAYLTGVEPLATWTGVQLSRHNMFFSIAKAERELQFHPRPYLDGLKDALHWFSVRGYFGQPLALAEV